jgi:hypothetical protein
MHVAKSRVLMVRLVVCCNCGRGHEGHPRCVRVGMRVVASG